MFMSRLALTRFAPLLLSAALLPQAQAATQAVSFNVLNASATLSTPFAAGDNLRLDTLVTTQFGPLLQTVNFVVGAGVNSFSGQASWEVGTATGTGPRLIGVNIDIFDFANNLVVSDTFAGTLAGFGLSTFANTAITPGVYHLVATGTGVRDSSLDVTLSFAAGVVPEPGTYGLLLAGLGVVGLVARRRRA
jgi:hypothetical protein